MKKKLCIILMLTVLCVTLACGINTVFAEETGEAATLVSVTDAETRGVYVEVSVGIKGNGNGTITATARNDFTLGFTELYVTVGLFSSDEFTMFYEDMEMVTYNFTQDLDIFKEISTTASTNGVAKYWRAVVMYRKDTDDWKTISTPCMLYDGNGNLIE